VEENLLEVYSAIAGEATQEVRSLLARAARLAAVVHTEHADALDTWERLNAHGLDNAEIERQLASLKWNTAENPTAAITTYSYLHGLQYLDLLEKGRTRGSEAVVALYQCAEICLCAIAALSDRMLRSLQSGNLDQALSDQHWRNGFHQLLYRLGLLVVELNEADEDVSLLRLRDSRIFSNYREGQQRLHDWLITSWGEQQSDIFTKSLNDPKRNLFFSEYVNSGDERVWISLFSETRLSGVSQAPDEDMEDFYARVVGSAEVERMLRAMETNADTDLLPFRVIHQVTEVAAGVANRLACDAAARLLTAADEELLSVLQALTAANRILSVADESIKFIQRALSPAAYSNVRPNLGMVRGTSSIVLRKTLFNSTYPLLVRAFKLRIMNFDSALADDDIAVTDRAKRLRRGPGGALLPIQRQLVLLHQHVRVWRDNHIQLPKTHLGESQSPDPPTVSLSGSDSGVRIAHGLRGTHGEDCIVPLYRGLLGTAPPPVHELLSQDGFDSYMARLTAKAVFAVYSDVQERFYRRCPMHFAKP
jgi:hypothetical protein